MLTQFTQIQFVETLVRRIFCIGLFVTSAESLHSVRQYADTGIFSWKMMRLAIPASLRRTRLEPVLGMPGMRLIYWARVLGSILLWLDLPPSLTSPLLAMVAATSLLISYRNQAGNDGADQMSNILVITLLIASLCRDGYISRLSIYFLCTQAVLSYGIAGFAKFISPKWQKGLAVFQIINTESFGNERIARLLREVHPAWCRILGWNVILFELSFPGVVFLPLPYTLVVLAWGIVFHLFTARVMGLNHFLWVFLATYPAIIFTNLAWHR